MKDWIDFDKISVAQTSLEMLLYCLKSVKNKPEYWQWIYITLHSAVQGYMVLALTGTNSLLTYSDECAKEWLRCYENETVLPDCYLDKFMNLYKKIKSDRFLLFLNSQKYQPTSSQKKNIKRLNDIRNTFVHYKIDLFMASQSDFPYEIVLDCLNFIEFLALKSNNIFWGEEENKSTVEKLLNDCRAVIQCSE